MTILTVNLSEMCDCEGTVTGKNIVYLLVLMHAIMLIIKLRKLLNCSFALGLTGTNDWSTNTELLRYTWSSNSFEVTEVNL